MGMPSVASLTRLKELMEACSFCDQEVSPPTCFLFLLQATPNNTPCVVPADVLPDERHTLALIDALTDAESAVARVQEGIHAMHVAFP